MKRRNHSNEAAETVNKTTALELDRRRRAEGAQEIFSGSPSLEHWRCWAITGAEMNAWKSYLMKTQDRIKQTEICISFGDIFEIDV